MGAQAVCVFAVMFCSHLPAPPSDQEKASIIIMLSARCGGKALNVQHSITLGYSKRGLKVYPPSELHALLVGDLLSLESSNACWVYMLNSK